MGCGHPLLRIKMNGNASAKGFTSGSVWNCGVAEGSVVLLSLLGLESCLYNETRLWNSELFEVGTQLSVSLLRDLENLSVQCNLKVTGEQMWRGTIVLQQSDGSIIGWRWNTGIEILWTLLCTHLDLLMNVKIFSVLFHSDVTEEKSVETCCCGASWSWFLTEEETSDLLLWC